MNSTARVAERIKRLYSSKYGATQPFVPKLIENAVEYARSDKQEGASLIYDKTSTPAEPESNVGELWATLRPTQIVAERSSNSLSGAHDEHAYVFSRYQTVDVQTGSTTLNQFVPWYLGMAHPYTLLAAVGGWDVPGKEWRRPQWEDVTRSGS